MNRKRKFSTLPSIFVCHIQKFPSLMAIDLQGYYIGISTFIQKNQMYMHMNLKCLYIIIMHVVVWLPIGRIKKETQARVDKMIVTKKHSSLYICSIPRPFPGERVHYPGGKLRASSWRLLLAFFIQSCDKWRPTNQRSRDSDEYPVLLQYRLLVLSWSSSCSSYHWSSSSSSCSSHWPRQCVSPDCSSCLQY